MNGLVLVPSDRGPNARAQIKSTEIIHVALRYALTSEIDRGTIILTQAA